MSDHDYIHFHRYSFGPEEREAVLTALDSGWITKGPRVAEFEQQIADYTGAKHALALNSCTAGLHLALLAYNIGPGDEVITTPLTFVATANVIVHVGAHPVLVDVNPETLNIDPEAIARAITPRTKAIIPVHYAGQPCDMERIAAIAKAHQIPIIEDAAHAIGSHYHGQAVGSLTDVTVFSFYATKNITTGEGGMITTDNDELMARLRPLSLHGLSQDAWKRYSAQGFRHYTVEEPGYKYNMTDIAAALGLVQMKKCDTFTALRQERVQIYQQALSHLPLSYLGSIPDIVHSHHLFPVRLQLEALSISRDELLSNLQAEGIGAAVHFIPVHRHPFYQRLLPEVERHLPIATRAGEDLISLPLYPDLTGAQQERVIAVLEAQLQKSLR